jgi:DNA-binding response OmpR family regulator
MPSPKTKILIVDDEADICFFLDRNLSKRGFSTSVFHTLAQAEKGVKALNPNILLLDNHLPDGRGVEFANRMSNEYPAMKIIMITAHDSQLDRTTAYDSGVDFFLSKPFSLKDINEIVDSVMTKPSFSHPVAE